MITCHRWGTGNRWRIEDCTKRRFEIDEVSGDYVLYELIFDPTLNKSVPCGHRYVGRFLSMELAYKHLTKPTVFIDKEKARKAGLAIK